MDTTLLTLVLRDAVDITDAALTTTGRGRAIPPETRAVLRPVAYGKVVDDLLTFYLNHPKDAEERIAQG